MIRMLLVGYCFGRCALKQRCAPNQDIRKIARHMYGDARDKTRLALCRRLRCTVLSPSSVGRLIGAVRR